MKLTTNLATRRYINMRRLNAALIASFLILAGLLVFKVREAAYRHAELNRIKEQIAQANRRPGVAVDPAKLKALETKIAFANSLIAQKAVNWLTLLDRLEEVVPAGVALTQIEPTPRDKMLKLNGVAHSFDNLRTLLEKMEQSQTFSEVYLVRQGDLKVGQTQQGINFSITCKVSYR